MNLIHQKKQWNMMSQDMLDSHMHIRTGVECNENRKRCDKCQDLDSPIHCHSQFTDITEEMRGKCKKAWEKCKVAQKEALEEKKLITTENKEKREKSEKIEAERKKKMLETVARKSYF